MEYIDFDIEIGKGSGREYPLSVNSVAAGQAHETLRFPFDEVQLQLYLSKLQIALLRSGGKRRKAATTEEDTVKVFGQALFNALFTGEIRNRFDVSLERAEQQGKGLRVKLRIQAPEIATLPWEYLYDPRTADYLCLDNSKPIVRYLSLPQPPQTTEVKSPLRILGMLGHAADLDVDEEKLLVEKSLQGLQQRGLVELKWVEGHTWRDLQKALRPGQGTYHIFHFIGHGGFDESNEEGLIELTDEDGKTQNLRATQLAHLLRNHRSLKLVILNACEGARGSNTNLFSGTAAILVQKAIPAVLAMQYEITDRAAIEFSRTFYEALADGVPLEVAVSEARVAINVGINNSLEWGTPVLYTRLLDGVLFELAIPTATRLAPPEIQVSIPSAKVQNLPILNPTEPPVASVTRVIPTPAETTTRLDLRGYFVLPDLYAQGYLRRLGRGVIHQVIPLDKNKTIIIAGGGAALFDFNNPEPQWEIDCPTQCGALSPDQRLLALGSNRLIYLWDVTSGNLRATLSGHSSYVHSVAFSPDSQTLASGSADKSVRLWEATSGRERRTLASHGASVFSVAFNPDGQLLASGSCDNSVKLWEVASGWERATLSGHSSYVHSVAFSPDSQTLASGSADSKVKLWEVASGRECRTLTGHGAAVLSVAFSPDGQTLASGSHDNSVKLWKTVSGNEWITLSSHSAAVKSVAFSPDGQTLASGSADKRVKLWEVASGQEYRTLSAYGDAVNSVAFNSNGQLLASGCADKRVTLWEVVSGQERHPLLGHSSYVNSVAFSPENVQLLASGSYDGSVKLWEVANGQEHRTLFFYGAVINSVAFSSDGQLLAFGCGDKSIKLWEVASGQERHTLWGHSNWVRCVAFSQDGQFLASGSYHDGHIKLWEVASGQECRAFWGHRSAVNSVIFSPDNHLLASGSDDNSVKLWEVASGQERRTLWGHSDTVGSVAFSSDGQLLASGSHDNSVKLWEVESGRVGHTFLGHSSYVNSVVFSPDRQTLASGSGDGTIRLWRVL
jgi:WD40 repeat protein